MRRIAAALLVWLCLAGCAGLGGPAPQPTQTAAQVPASPPPVQKTPSEQPPVEAQPAGTVLTVWLPKEFDPEGGTAAGDLLAEQLAAFSDLHPGVVVRARVKSTGGPAGLLDSLSAASAAAPDALPDLIALSSEDLETAALKGLVTSLDGQTSAIDGPDWYEFARSLTLVQNSSFGLPFAADTLALVYRPAKVAAPAADWAELTRQAGPLALPAADRQALLALTLYQAAGGAVEDNQGRPVLENEPLARALSLFETGMKTNTLPPWVAVLETDEQVWQAYSEQRADLAVTWVSRFLTETPPDSAARALPPLDGRSRTLARGWAWALSSPDAQRKALAVELGEHLVESSFLARWSEAARLIPPRPSALAAWINPNNQAFLGPVVASTYARPGNDLSAALSPVLLDAVSAVMGGQMDATQAAASAAQRLGNP